MIIFYSFPSSSNALTAAFNADNTNPCENEDVSFTSNSSSSVTTWAWTFEGGTPATSDEESPVVTYANPGTYNVILEVSDGTETATLTKDDYIIVHNCTGVNIAETNDVKLYPNPNTGVFFMDIQGMQNANITIVNSIGSVVYSENNFVVDNSMKRIDLSNEAEGIYMLVVENDNQRIIKKIVIK